MSARVQNDSLNGGAVAVGSSCNGTVGITRKMVHARVAELVSLDCRSLREATMSDFAQAKRELSGEGDMFVL